MPCFKRLYAARLITFNKIRLNWQRRYKSPIDTLSPKVLYRGKRITIPYSECVSQPSIPSMHCSCTLLHCHLWPVWLYRMFPHYLINGPIFKKPLLNISGASSVNLEILCITFLILSRIEPYFSKIWGLFNYIFNYLIPGTL